MDSVCTNIATLIFEIRHTKEKLKRLTYAEFMQYKYNCHTVVEVHITVIGDTSSKYVFNPRSIRKFVCLRKLYLTNVKFLNCIFTVPKYITFLRIESCTKIKTIIPNETLSTLRIYNSDDLVAIGPVIPNNCYIFVSNCKNLRNLPRTCVNEFEKKNNLVFYLSNTPQVCLDSLPDEVYNIQLLGNIKVTAARFPIVNSITIPVSLFNSMHGIISVTNDIYLTSDGSVLTQPAVHSLIDRVIKNNINIIHADIANNTTMFVISCLCKRMRTLNLRIGNIDKVFKLLTDICPKYVSPVNSIKFNPNLSLYESIIVSALPAFYNCLLYCKKIHPIKFSIFCNKMRDIMRQS